MNERRKSSKPRLTPETEVTYVKGVGPKRAKALAEAGVFTAADLLRYYPTRYLDRSTITAINALREGDSVVVLGRLSGVKLSRLRRSLNIITALLSDNTGSVILTWFNQKWLMDKLPDIENVIVAGKVGQYKGLQITVEEYEPVDDRDSFDAFGGIIPIYRTPGPLNQKALRTAISLCLDEVAPYLDDPIPDEIRARNKIPPLTTSVTAIHRPETLEQKEHALNRMAFAELFLMETGLAIKRSRDRAQEGAVIKNKGKLRESLRLPFDLTAAQRRVIAEIDRDLAAPYAMSRLLQGDVGSGKTVVALLAMLSAVEAGYQAALMAPTEMLAEQHWRGLAELVTPLGLRCELLTGSTPAATAKKIIADCNAGLVPILIGTHALIEERVAFPNLGLVVIDEQHRFGVAQRGRLTQKGRQPNVLVMTATPIPRTLALSVYGDLDLSILDEMPAGRRPIKTLWFNETKRERAYDIIRDRLKTGRQAFFVYPLVEESEKLELKSAEQMLPHLRDEAFPDYNVALVHGRMSAADKEDAMRRFRNGETDILVATTVVEVGIDIRNAAVMVVEHAERFGLSQLHQLRGRIGRGEHPSICILMSSYKVTAEGKKRLETMVGTNDGFRIAEVDFEIRGPGELMGARQHGVPDTALRAVLETPKLLQKARNEAFRLVEENPALEGDEYAPLRKLIKSKYAERLGLAETV
ncbi:MAG: ATP-dependent DNA helicase RecG [bacterium]|nr:ATP-dependent DNA helicase RecG [bacterium]